MVYCEIPKKEVWSKAYNCNSWSLGPVFYPKEKANVIANYLEKLFTPHKACDADHDRRVEARVQALLTTVVVNPRLKFEHVTSQNKSDP
jgi:hypothetical protein